MAVSVGRGVMSKLAGAHELATNANPTIKI